MSEGAGDRVDYDLAGDRVCTFWGIIILVKHSRTGCAWSGSGDLQYLPWLCAGALYLEAPAGVWSAQSWARVAPVRRDR